MTLFDPDLVKERLNADPEFKLAARLWNTSVRIDVGDHAFILDIRDGVVDRFTARPPEDLKQDSWQVRISAPVQDWAEMTEPVPRPFFQDFYSAMSREHLTMDGDLDSLFAYYPALRRMLEVMREARAPEPR